MKCQYEHHVTSTDHEAAVAVVAGVPTCIRCIDVHDHLWSQWNAWAPFPDEASIRADERAKSEAALKAADQVVHEAWRMLAGGDDGPAEKCGECGCGGCGYLRDALAAYRAARSGSGSGHVGNGEG